MDEFEYVQRHDCPMLGENTYTPKAIMADETGTYILYYQYHCPFCDYISGEKDLAPGVVDTGSGYTVDISKAEKLHGN